MKASGKSIYTVDKCSTMLCSSDSACVLKGCPDLATGK